MHSVAPIFTMLAVCHGFTNPLGPYLMGKMNYKLVLILGCSIALGGITISSFMTSLWTFAFTFTVTFGLGIGMCYVVPLILGWEFYPTK